eukprot:CAMPEP_0171088440 /NCGR_PEP_ID=MMETSP0766_2-20121228/20783_1 /TAXON_ID=439317 /ORGANISM="Gambierdiscus australes, Strain CAWD 149" /LENGTH=125 /DNA_ID=CAMNT_0011546241 /DNA_START=55 /DNA_END=429 /DNA_ORIENTATION=-
MSRGASSSAASQTQTTSSGAPTLHLILEPRPQHHVQWSQDTIDNEHMNKRKSKKCCIYKKPRDFGESSSESSGSDDDGRARPSQAKAQGRRLFCPFGQSVNGPGPQGMGPDGGPGQPAGSSSSSS